MSAQINLGAGQCCAQPAKGYRLLSFPDGSQIGVVGLDELFDDAHRDGKTPNPSVAIELVRRLSKRNYIPSNLLEEYGEVVLREYRKYCAGREGAKKQGG
jgi:hypothetical protein